MDLTCPKCGTHDTKKLSLVMSEGGMAEKGAQLGAAYFYNIIIPLMTVVFSFLLGLMFGLFHIVLGLLAFVGTLFAGFKIRSFLKAKMRSKFADLSPQMKQDGFRCSRCEHLFIPARSASA